jgi:hypothetical protein
MTILKCLEYPSIQICSVDDTKVNINWICTRSELVLQSKTNEHAIKQNTPYVDGITKYTVQRRDNKIRRTNTVQQNKSYEDGKSKQRNV